MRRDLLRLGGNGAMGRGILKTFPLINIILYIKLLFFTYPPKKKKIMCRIIEIILCAIHSIIQMKISKYIKRSF